MNNCCKPTYADIKPWELLAALVDLSSRKGQTATAFIDYVKTRVALSPSDHVNTTATFSKRISL